MDEGEQGEEEQEGEDGWLDIEMAAANELGEEFDSPGEIWVKKI